MLGCHKSLTNLSFCFCGALDQAIIEVAKFTLLMMGARNFLGDFLGLLAPRKLKCTYFSWKLRRNSRPPKIGERQITRLCSPFAEPTWVG